MQNIHREILPNISISHSTVKNICINFSKFEIVHLWYEQFLAFVGEYIC